VGYKLFTHKLIPSVSRKDMARVYRLLKEEREYGTIPWELIVDETRGLEIKATWSNPADFAKQMTAAYRRSFWDQQPVRVEVWSEKGTVRGVLKPVLDEYGVGFRVLHGFSSATSVYDVAMSDDERPLIALYVGDYDPSGLFMSEEDLPKRLAEYGGDHVDLRRVALTGEQVLDLPSFPASDKRRDPRYKCHRETRRELLGARRHGSERPPCLRDSGDQGADRARSVGALRDRQRGRAREPADHPRQLERGAATHTTSAGAGEAGEPAADGALP
jgi:hypothetical protein